MTRRVPRIEELLASLQHSICGDGVDMVARVRLKRAVVRARGKSRAYCGRENRVLSPRRCKIYKQWHFQQLRSLRLDTLCGLPLR